MKKILITIVLAIVVITSIILTIIAIYGLGIKNANSNPQVNPKGGKDALTVFDVNATKVEITYNDKTVSLIGEEHKEFINIIKDISGDGNAIFLSDTDYDDINYDMIIDFDNTYIGRISTESKIFLFEGDTKEISNENLDAILEYFN